MIGPPAAAAPALHTGRVESLAGLLALRREWEELVELRDDLTPFASWQWNATMARTVAAGAQLAIMVARDADGRPAGLAPLAVRRKAGIPVLVFLGSGLGDYSLADYQDFLLRPGSEEAALDALCDALAADPSWSALWLQELPECSPVASLLPAACARRGWRSAVEVAGDVYRAELPPTWAEFKDRLSHNTRSAIERKGRKLERERGGTYRRVAERRDLPDALEALFRLHTERWRSAGRPGIFAREAARSLHRELAPLLLDAGILDLSLLEAGGEVIGARYSFEMGGVSYFYASGYRVGEDWDRYSLGMQMDGYAFRLAIEDGLRAVDLLRGDGHYKLRYGAHAAYNLNLAVFRDRGAALRFRAFQSVERALRRRARSLRRALRGR